MKYINLRFSNLALSYSFIYTNKNNKNNIKSNTLLYL